MIQELVRLKKNGYNKTIADGRINELDDIPKGYKVKCRVCKKYSFVLELRGMNYSIIHNFRCEECR